MAQVLVVDDEPAVRALVARALEQAGHTVTQARSGKEALDALEQGSCDLIISDVYMDDMDGMEVLARLRGGEAEFPPVIVMSGGGFMDRGTVLEIAERLGAVATLEKPFQPAALLEAVREALPR